MRRIPSPAVAFNLILLMLQPDAGLSGRTADSGWSHVFASTGSIAETEVCFGIQLNKQMGVIAVIFLTTTNPQTRSLFYNEQ